MSTTPLERISWEVYCPFPRVRAAAEFTFAEKNRRTGVRYSKLRGGSYTSKRYTELQDVAFLDLGTDDYIVLKHSKHDFKKDSTAGKVVMSYPHLRRFIEGIEDMLELARDGCFEEVGEAFQLTKRGEAASVVVSDLFNGATVVFSPIVFMFQPEDDAEDDDVVDYSGEPGIRMFVNSMELYSDVTLDHFATFAHFYERFDLFATSRAAVQIAMVQQGGIKSATMTKTPMAQPTRRSSLSTGLGMKNKAAE